VSARKPEVFSEEHRLEVTPADVVVYTPEYVYQSGEVEVLLV